LTINYAISVSAIQPLTASTSFQTCSNPSLSSFSDGGKAHRSLQCCVPRQPLVCLLNSVLEHVAKAHTICYQAEFASILYRLANYNLRTMTSCFVSHRTKRSSCKIDPCRLTLAWNDFHTEPARCLRRRIKKCTAEVRCDSSRLWRAHREPGIDARDAFTLPKPYSVPVH
jgi:hypothetical protein